MTAQDRQQFWRQHIDAWQASGLSGTVFCKQRDLNCAQFNYWRKQPQATEAVVA